MRSRERSRAHRRASDLPWITAGFGDSGRRREREYHPARAQAHTTHAMAETGVNTRLEAFCDGVFAIALTLLIIDIKLPSTERIGSNAELWRALLHLAPSVFAFLLSFVIILITWVNHHATLSLIHRSSAPFIYANGLLLLTVVFIPFPTALLGEFLWTDHAAPAVVFTDAVLAVQAIGWIVVTGTALKGQLITDDTIDGDDS